MRDVCAQISGVVGEHQVGLRQMLRTMGMLDSAYWLSWMLFEVPSNQHLHGVLATPTFFSWTDTLSRIMRGPKFPAHRTVVATVAQMLCCKWISHVAEQSQTCFGHTI